MKELSFIQEYKNFYEFINKSFPEIDIKRLSNFDLKNN